MSPLAGCFAILALLFLQFSVARGEVTPFLTQSFFFDWNVPGQPVPVPVTAQCETIHITWSRGTATGPNPTAPYFLQVYTSAFLSPIIIEVGDDLSYDWAVPFAPGTLYQICMFDKYGNTGGCQATYTVIHPVGEPTCSNVTFPAQLGVAAVVDNGPLSQYGWIDQCTDISLTPTNGTPPYTLTVAPALHPPYNITIDEKKAVNWTVSLNWASPFFISLVDGTGASWSNGPLHAGGGGTIGCLAGNVKKTAVKVGMGTAIGSGIGGAAAGIAVGILLAFIFLRRSWKRKFDEARFVEDLPSPMFQDRLVAGGGYRSVATHSSLGTSSAYPSTPSRMAPTGDYQVEAFTMPMPDEEGRTEGHHLRSPTSPNAPSTRITSMADSVSAPLVPRAPNQGGHVYVVHHDSNAPPVTIYHQEGTDVVELPPRYPPDNFGPASSQRDLNRGQTQQDYGHAGQDYRQVGQSYGHPSQIEEQARSAAASSSTRSDSKPSENLQIHQPRLPNIIEKPQPTKF